MSFTDNVTVRKRGRFDREHSSGLILLFLRGLWETLGEKSSR